MNDVMDSIRLAFTAFAIYGLLATLLAAAAIGAWPGIRRLVRRGCAEKPVERAVCAAVVAVCVFAAILYGGDKPHYVPNAGADDGIGLVHITAVYDSTNDVTEVEVAYTSGNVTTATPVSVRNAASETWRELEKIGATIIGDSVTNRLAFTTPGNATTNRYWWVGVDTPAVVVEDTGITVTFYEATSQHVAFAWTCDNPSITEFAIQRRRVGATEWETVAVTTDRAYMYVGFTIGESWQWRISATYTEGE